MQTRFLHCADIHLGYLQYGQTARFNDFAAAFNAVIDKATGQYQPRPDKTTLAFDDYTGSSLRGGLVTALQRNFCPVKDQADAAHQAICPVCWLLSHEATPGDSRRPYAVEPLVGEHRHFAPGQRFRFGLTLFGQAVNLFPYLVLAVRASGASGHRRWLRR